MIASWRRYWFAPADYLDLSIVRIVACATQLFLVLVLFPQYLKIQQRALLPDDYFDPVIILNAFHIFLGWGFRPGQGLVQAIFFVSIAAGTLSLVGLLTNFSLLLFAATSVYLQAYVYSFGDSHHPEAVMMIALSVLALSPSGRVLSVDAWLRNRSRAESVPGITLQSQFAGWPIKLLQWFFALMYLSAVKSKLAASGLDWANGYTLQYFLAREGMRWGSPLGLWLSQFHTFILLCQVGILLFQATFSLAVIVPKLRWVYVPAGLLLHIGIFLTLSASFFTWIALYAVFIPWSQAVRWIRDHLRASGRLRMTASQDRP